MIAGRVALDRLRLGTAAGSSASVLSSAARRFRWMRRAGRTRWSPSALSSSLCRRFRGARVAGVVGGNSPAARSRCEKRSARRSGIARMRSTPASSTCGFSLCSSPCTCRLTRPSRPLLRRRRLDAGGDRVVQYRRRAERRLAQRAHAEASSLSLRYSAAPGRSSPSSCSDHGLHLHHVWRRDGLDAAFHRAADQRHHRRHVRHAPAAMLSGVTFFSHEVGGFLGVGLAALCSTGSVSTIWSAVGDPVRCTLRAINAADVEKPVARMAPSPA